MKPSKYQIFKGKSALRLSMAKPQANYETGYLYAELAEVLGKDANGNRTYNWEQKIPLKLGIVDIAKLAYALERGYSCELFHEFKGTTKGISLQRAEGGQSPYFFAATQKSEGSEQKKISVPIAAEEAYALLTLFKHSITAIHSW